MILILYIIFILASSVFNVWIFLFEMHILTDFILRFNFWVTVTSEVPLMSKEISGRYEKRLDFFDANTLYVFLKGNLLF